MIHLLKIAPLKDSYDFFVALLLLIVPQIILWYHAIKASKSGSIEKASNPNSGVPYWRSSDKNVPVLSTGFGIFAILHFVFWNIFFWAFLWSDHHDVWFI